MAHCPASLAVKPAQTLLPLCHAQACLMSLFYGAIAVVLNADATLGARVVASASLIGAGWVGLLMTGALVRPFHITWGHEYHNT